LEVKTRNPRKQREKARRKRSWQKELLPEKQPTTRRTDQIRSPKPQRINQILSLAGITSRRKADDLIKAGRVIVNGRVLREPGSQAVWGTDSIRVDSHEIPGPSERVYVALNKPFGYVCTLRDPEGRPAITELLRGLKQRVYPVGRLDFDSLGLLLLTNDGEWAYRLSHPRFRVPRTYKITIEGAISQEALHMLAQGVPLEDGFSGPAKVTLLQRGETRSVIRMTLTSGKKRIVRRMIEAAGHRVIQLLRIGFGVLELGNLKVGKFRYLKPDEVEATKKLVGLA
jgi:23S rRNA pseudouridine2605 synthase